jgi:hypothetical protein
MTQGAASYLVQLIENPSQSARVTRQIGIGLDELQNDFLRGVASPDSAIYDRGVGKVHIVDMFCELLNAPPVLPDEGVVSELIHSTRETALEGNKPKALAYLDVMEALKELESHGLHLEKGLGRKLAQRLYTAARHAANNREYHPARIVHDKLIALHDLGIRPGDHAFPSSTLDDYLRGEGYVMRDDFRLALGRYLRILESLHAANVHRERPGVHGFLVAMQDCLSSRASVLSEGATYLDKLLEDNTAQGGGVNDEAISHALAQWTVQATRR